jgi:hypothetical protein
MSDKSMSFAPSAVVHESFDLLPQPTDGRWEHISATTALGLVEHLKSQLTDLRNHQAMLMSLLPISLRMSESTDGSIGRSLVGQSHLDLDGKYASGTTDSPGSSIRRPDSSSGSFSPSGEGLFYRPHNPPRSRSRSGSHADGAVRPFTPYTTLTSRDTAPVASSHEDPPQDEGLLAYQRQGNHAHRQSLSSLISEVTSLYFDAEEGNVSDVDEDVEREWAGSLFLAAASVQEETLKSHPTQAESWLDLDYATPGSPPAVAVAADEVEGRPRRDSEQTVSATAWLGTAKVQRRTKLPVPSPTSGPNLTSALGGVLGNKVSSTGLGGRAEMPS